VRRSVLYSIAGVVAEDRRLALCSSDDRLPGPAARRTLPAPAPTDVQRDAREPWPESSGVLQPLQTEEGGDGCLLSSVLREFRTPHTLAEAHNHGSVALKERPEHLPITSSGECDEFRIA
jgi:hypothetical protein